MSQHSGKSAFEVAGIYRTTNADEISMYADQLYDSEVGGGKFQSEINHEQSEINREQSEFQKAAGEVLEFRSVNYRPDGTPSPDDPYPQVNLGHGNYHYVSGSSELGPIIGMKKLSVFTTYVCAADFGLNYCEGEAYRAKEPAAEGGNWSLVMVASNGTKDYLDLENKPTLNGVELDGDMGAADLGLAELASTVTMEVTYDDASTAAFHVVVNPYAQEAVAASVTPDEEEGWEYGE